MATVTFDNASRKFSGSDTPAVDCLNFTIEDGECVVLVGPSGCGKSTSLRMIAGLEPTTSGRILIDDKDMTKVRPRNRDVAMVFQSYALYPNMTVAQNMAFALENKKMPTAKIQERVLWAAKMLQLEDLLQRKPAALSGGQRQRVAMGRAIVRKPTVFCMDEPLSNLDAKLRVSMRSEIATLQRNLGVTTVYVTHDQTEAMTMGHRVAVLRDGKLQQIDTPETLYKNPVNTFVAGFIGSPAIALIERPIIDASHVMLGSACLPVPPTILSQARDSIIVGIRPESWEIVPESKPGLSLVTDIVEMLGSQAFLYGKAASPSDNITVQSDDGTQRIAVMLERGQHPQPDEVVRVAPRPGEVYFFDPLTHDAI